jgi:hypothetical protein
VAKFDPPAKLGNEVYCRRCEKYVYVLVAVIEWRIKCLDCSLGHRFGDDETSARRAAIRHVGKRQDHVVDVFRADKLIATVKANEEIIPGSLPDRYHVVTKTLPT